MTHEYEEDNLFPIDIKLGEFIRKKRRLMGQNQTDFGLDLGYGQKTISKWEAGETSPPFRDAEDIVEYLGGKIIVIPIELYERILSEYGDTTTE